jgi:3-hydroxybutyryl-CoA dehydrogenase
METLAIVGGGTVATGLAACAARGGMATLLVRSDESATRAAAAIARVCEKMGDGWDASRVEITRDIGRLADASFIIEAVTEELSVKLDVLAVVAEVASADALLASTTSSLSIERLSTATRHPERFVGLHVFTPVPKMQLVELAFPRAALPDTRERAQNLCLALDKTAVEVPDRSGFIVNRLLFPYLFDAVRLLEQTGMAPDAIDACMRMGAGHPMGPIALLDYVGLDVAEAIGDNLGLEVPALIRALVREGRFGRKTGSGLHGTGP